VFSMDPPRDYVSSPVVNYKSVVEREREWSKCLALKEEGFKSFKYDHIFLRQSPGMHTILLSTVATVQSGGEYLTKVVPLKGRKF
jgi:hypothetical protein